MNVIVKVTLRGGLYEAACQRAKTEERDTKRSDGVASLCRHALRQYLNKNGFPTALLDADDSEYQKAQNFSESGLPAARNGSENEATGGI